MFWSNTKLRDSIISEVEIADFRVTVDSGS